MNSSESSQFESRPGNDKSLFAEGGEVGFLLSRIDWAKTSLGSVGNWSPALRTMVGMVLKNRSPLVLWWGPDLVQIYNDAFRSIPATKHPRALAQPAAECWADIWGVVGPMIEAPLRGQPATGSDDLMVLVNRRGFLEETHFKFAYSPVPDESLLGAGIGGVLGTVAEITEEVYAARQLATLRDLARQAGNAATGAGACAQAALILAGNDRDVPCALLYLLDTSGDRADLAGSSGFDQALLDGSLPETITFAEGCTAVWPVDRALRQGMRNALESRTSSVVAGVAWMGLPRGAWTQVPDQVVILPLFSPEQSQAYGVMVVGVSPYRELDSQYRTFLDLAADHVAAAIRNARAYQQERQRAKRLAEVERAKTAFFSNVSHEFRTPLTLLLGPLEDMRAESTPGTTQRGRLDVVQRNALRLLKLVNTLLDFSRMEAGRVEASYQATDLAASTSDLATSFRATIARAGLDLVVDCPPLPEPVYVDRDMWEKIVLNLLSNAFKFTFAGSISVRLRVEGECVALDVADTGVGIASQDLPRLFERFYRVEGVRSRTHEGSGIGLAFVRELTRMHRGEVVVESAVGTGTTFTIRIPRGSGHLPKEQLVSGEGVDQVTSNAPAFVEEARSWDPVRRPTRSSVPPATPEQVAVAARDRVLFADDNADMREYVTRLLSRKWRVEAVEDGIAALEAIARERPALVVADVMMPRLDGFGLLRTLRAAPATQNLPMLLLSARAGEESTLQALQAGANDYLIKPFSAGDLLARVSSQLKIAALRDEVEHEREAARRLMEGLFNAAPAAIALIRGSDLVVAFANPRCLELWRRTKASDVEGKPLLTALPELRGQGLDDVLRRVMASGKPESASELAASVSRAGTEHQLRLNYVYVPTRDAKGTVDGVSLFAFDVTRECDARNRAELGEQVGHALVRQETLAAQLTQCCTTLVAMGAASARIWTYDSTRDLLELHASAGVYVPSAGPHVHVSIGSRKAGLIAKNRQPIVIQNVIGDPRVADQEWATREALVSFAGYPLIVGQRLVGVIAVYTNVELSEGMRTTIATIADQIAIAVDRDSSERFRELFIGILGHDLRNPLNAVLMAQHLLMETAAEAEKKLLTRLGGSAKRMERMITQLLDFTRARSGGGIALLREPCDLSAICTQAVEELKTANPQHRIEMTATGDARGLWDTDRMAQVFSNLIANAVSYGGTERAVAINVEATQLAVTCSVHNFGIPIPEDLVPYLFDPFRRARHAKAAAAQGLGLGLFICQQIVAAHSGTTVVQSSAELGTTFTVTLPKQPVVV
ncbi:MAG TPA: ATP-binding protein [Polyangiaceae bacterium]|nr:ATP-binding protein [Polyangiaceae bacterium]